MGASSPSNRSSGAVRARRPGGRAAAAAVLVIACGAWGVADARASCGDWLEGHQTAGHVSGVHAAAETAADPVAGDAAPASRPARGPCRGPTCSTRPVSTPALPSEPPRDTAGERWCRLAEPPGPRPEARCAVADADEPAPRSASAGRLERPPRNAPPGRS